MNCLRRTCSPQGMNPKQRKVLHLQESCLLLEYGLSIENHQNLDHLSRLCAELGSIAKVMNGVCRDESLAVEHSRCQDHGNVAQSDVVARHCHGSVDGGRGNKEGNDHPQPRLLLTLYHQHSHFLKEVTFDIL